MDHPDSRMTHSAPTSMAELVTAFVGHDELVRAVFSGVPKADPLSVHRVVIRRIQLRDQPHLQVNSYTAKNCMTRNYGCGDALPLDELTAIGFRNAHLELATATIEARVAKRGQLLMSRKATANASDEVHDKAHTRLLAEDAPFLEVVGMSRGGVVKPTSQRKYRQINEFLRTVDATLGPAAAPGARLRVVDLGCGNAYLTFALFHLLSVIRGADCVVIGVDRTPEAVRRNNERAEHLGWQGRLTFVTSDIGDFTPDETPDLVMSLHSCDTATDEALAKGVRWKAPFILASPCCHHHLQRQLRAAAVPEGVGEIMQDGVLREQLGDVLTDAFRAALLRMAGYTVDVFAFVPLEDSARNTLIRAVRGDSGGAAASAVNVEALMRTFQVRPYLAELIEADHAQSDHRVTERTY
jgi:SAM-dependent methyltransferase